MSQLSRTEPTNTDVDTEPTALQQAVRKRALDNIAEQQSRPPVPLSRRLLIIGLTLLAVMIFLVVVNFAVTGMFKILDIWYPGSISGRVTQPATSPVPSGVDQPFYITVDPPLESAPLDQGATSSSSSAVKDAPH